MASLNPNELKKIPQRNKDLVFGQLKRFERKHNHSYYPLLIKNLCLVYTNDVDKFDISSDTNDSIKIKPNEVIGYDTDKLLDSDQRDVYFENKLQNGINTWKIQINYTPDSHPTSSKGILLLETTEEVTFKGNKPDKYAFGIVLNTRLIAWKTGVHLHFFEDMMIPSSMENKIRVKNGDIIKLKYDGNTKNVYYKINDDDFIQIIKGDIVPNGSYRLKLRVYGGNKITYKLLSYQNEV